MGLRRGARQLLDEIEALEKEGFDALTIATQRVKYNPDFAIAKIHEAIERFREARNVRDEQLPEMLQKAAPPIQAQVDELRERIEALEAERKVIQLRREA